MLRPSALLLCAWALVAGCARSEPFTPAEAARRKVEFLRENAVRIDANRVELIRRVPYGSRNGFEHDLEEALRGREASAIPADRHGRRRLLGRGADDVFVGDAEGSEPGGG